MAIPFLPYQFVVRKAVLAKIENIRIELQFCSILGLYKRDGILFTLFAFYSREMALSISLDSSLNNMYDWKGVRERVGKGTKVFIINDENSVEFSMGVTLVLKRFS
jgi:hypothetical protein